MDSSPPEESEDSSPSAGEEGPQYVSWLLDDINQQTDKITNTQRDRQIHVCANVQTDRKAQAER